MPPTGALVAIVEDASAMSKSLERLLRAHGYSTVGFSSAEEFLESGVAERATGLVLDIHLGGMTGIELRRRLVSVGSNLPVVFITAFDDEATRAAALGVGCVAYLQKPFEASLLMDALERGTRS